MHLKLKRIPLSIIIFFQLMAGSLYAQYYGSGMYQAMPTCQYDNDVADGAVDEQDAIVELKAKLKDLKDDKKENKKSLDRAAKDVKKQSETLELSLKSNATTTVLTHITSGMDCGDYEGFYKVGGVSKSLRGDEASIGCKKDDASCIEKLGGGQNKHEPFSDDEWSNYCDMNTKRTLRASLCDKYSNNKLNCVASLPRLIKAANEYDKYDAKQVSIENDITQVEDELSQATKDYKTALRDAQKENSDDTCISCMLAGNGHVSHRNKPSIGEIVAGVGLGLAGMYAGNQAWKASIKTNAQLGFPTNPMQGVGYPFMLGMAGLGLYGAVTGGQNGSFGCGSGIGNPYGMNGMMGYPGSMYAGMGMPGGGMWLPGGYPFGMNGGMGMGGMGMMGMMGGMPMMGGMAGAMGMGGMPMMGMMGGMPMMGGMAGAMGMGGMPMMGMMGGMPMSGGIAGAMGMGGMPMMGMMGGMPTIGGIAGAMGMGGMPMMGMMGGMPMSGGIAGAMGMGGMPMMGMMGGMSMSGGMAGLSGGLAGMDGGIGSMQMQQQMMQMQMQQTQVWMAQQKQMQDNMMSRNQMLGGLQGELSNLLFRMQQVQYGLGASGSMNGSGMLGIQGGMNPGMGMYPGMSPGGGYYPMSTSPSGGTVPSVR